MPLRQTYNQREPQLLLFATHVSMNYIHCDASDEVRP